MAAAAMTHSSRSRGGSAASAWLAGTACTAVSDATAPSGILSRSANPFRCAIKVGRCLVALVRILRHHAGRGSAARSSGIDRIDRPRIERSDVLMSLELLRGGPFRHRRPAGESVVEGAAERVDVAAHVGVGAARAPVPARCSRTCPSVTPDCVTPPLTAGIQMPGQAHVDDLRPAVRRDDDVRRLDVAVDDALARPRGSARPRSGSCNARTRPAESAALIDQLPEVLPFDELESDEVQPLVFAAEVDAGDVLVIEHRGGPCFLLEPAHALRVASGFGRQDLQSARCGRVRGRGPSAPPPCRRRRSTRSTRSAQAARQPTAHRPRLGGALVGAPACGCG